MTRAGDGGSGAAGRRPVGRGRGSAWRTALALGLLAAGAVQGPAAAQGAGQGTGQGTGQGAAQGPASPAPAAPRPSEYRLSPGDVLELVITGTPEVRQRIPLELNGDAAFPLIGGVPAGGRTLAEVRAKVQELLPQQVFRNRSFTGSEALQVIEPHEIHVSIAAYRPVYLQGDVARTGSVEFQPGLTVRQAVAVSGGYDLLRSGAGSSLVEALELRNQHETLAISLAKERARIWRLESALGRSASFDRSQFAAVDPDTLAEIVRLESEHLKTYRNDHQSQKAELAAAIEAATGRLDSLTTQSKSEEEGSRLDEVEMERVNDLFRKGLVPITRVNDVRRVALLVSTRALQTRIAAENVRKEREELKNQLRRVDDTRRMELLKELQEANANAERLQTQVRSAREKMLLAGSSRLALARSAGAKLDIAIFRKGQGGQARIAGTEDSELMPGDVVEIVSQVGTGLDGPAPGSAASAPAPAGPAGSQSARR